MILFNPLRFEWSVKLKGEVFPVFYSISQTRIGAQKGVRFPRTVSQSGCDLVVPLPVYLQYSSLFGATTLAWQLSPGVWYGPFPSLPEQ